MNCNYDTSQRNRTGRRYFTMIMASLAILIISGCKTQDGAERVSSASEDSKTDGTVDSNHNYMRDQYETAKDRGTECLEKRDAGCEDGFCDSFTGYRCSTRCTADEQCVSDAYFCRSDGRCAPKQFVSVWSVGRDGEGIRFPGGFGDDCRYTIDWGDGNQEAFDTCSPVRSHTYAKAGVYEIAVTGTLTNWGCTPEFTGLSECSNLKEIRSFGPVMLSAGAFYNAENLNKISETDIPNGNITNMIGMFSGAIQFNQAIDRWDTSHVKSMSGMFRGATMFNQPVERWDTSQVEDMSIMFNEATAFNQPVNRWDTSHVTNMIGMFGGASSFNQPLDQWDTSHVTNISTMFAGASSFNQPLDRWDTSHVIDMSGVFHHAGSFNQRLDGWNTSSVTKMDRMFAGASSFNQPLNSWNTSNVKTISRMFWRASSFNQSLERWDISNVVGFEDIFSDSGLSKEAWGVMKKEKAWADHAKLLGLPDGY